MRGRLLHVICWTVLAVAGQVAAQEEHVNHVGNPVNYDSLLMVPSVKDEGIPNMNPVKNQRIQQVHPVEDENTEQEDLAEGEGTEKGSPMKNNEMELLETLADEVVHPVRTEGSDDGMGPAEDEMVSDVFTHRTDLPVSSIHGEYTSVMNPKDEAATPAVDSLDDRSTKKVFGPVNDADAGVYGPASGKSNGVDNAEDLLAEMINAIVKSHLKGCHLVRFTSDRQSSELLHGLRRGAAGAELPSVEVEGESLFSLQQQQQEQLLQGLWEQPPQTCSALLLLLNDNYTLPFRFLEWCGVWRRPETRVLVVQEVEEVGGASAGSAQEVLLQPSLRNTIHALYLSFHHDNTAHRHNTRNTIGKRDHQVHEWSKSVWLYGRCLYCHKGEARVRLLHRFHLNSSVPEDLQLFPGLGTDWEGHEFQTVSMKKFPYVDFREDSKQPGAPVIPSDSLDIRMLNALAAHLNFTYVLREPRDRQWGVPTADGNWSGTVGTLQHQLADFSLSLAPTAPRLKVLDHSWIYISESFVIISLQPQLLPQSLSLVRPFAGWTWIVVVGSGFFSGLVLWLLHKAESKVSGGRGVRLDSSVLHSWGLLIENPAPHPPVTTSPRMLVGWCLVSSLVICTAYRSSLVAHLTLPRRSPPIDSFHDLLKADNWRWGRQPSSGTSFTFFNKSSDPIVNEVFQNVEYHELKEQLELVLAGRYSFITDKYFIKAVVAAHLTDGLGYTVIHTSTKEYPIYAGFSWGFRKGAPFRPRFSTMQQRLTEAGVVDYWIDDVINGYARRSRRERRLSEDDEGQQEQHDQRTEDEGSHVVLRLRHLQGAFFLMLLGQCAALLVCLAEVLRHHCSR